MITLILSLFRGCQHKHFTFPRTTKEGHCYQAKEGHCYQACVECGKQFAYDWAAMRRLGPVDAPAALVQCPVTAARREA